MTGLDDRGITFDSRWRQWFFIQIVVFWVVSIYSCRQISTFQKNMVPPSSGLKSLGRRITYILFSLARRQLFLLRWRHEGVQVRNYWRRNKLPKRKFIMNHPSKIIDMRKIGYKDDSSRASESCALADAPVVAEAEMWEAWLCMRVLNSLQNCYWYPHCSRGPFLVSKKL